MSRPAQLAHCTYEEVERYLEESRGIFLPTGSVEQHGPTGAIGTDALCADAVALGAARRCRALVAPAVAYSPAPFNMGFAGTVSIGADLFRALVAEIATSLAAHGFERIYVLNGHGANIAPLEDLEVAGAELRIRSWWDFETVNCLRERLYGQWEGMHATPSEIAIVQATHRVVDVEAPPRPAAPLTPEFVARHAGDRHGPPAQHRAAFPDGRVGSDPSLARPGDGAELLAAASRAVAADFDAFVGGRRSHEQSG